MDIFAQAEKHTDEHGHVDQLNHLDYPFKMTEPQALAGPSPGFAPRSPNRALADAYIQTAMPHFGIEASLASEMLAVAGAPASENQLVFDQEKTTMGNATVTYLQQHAGIPVWESGMVVQIEEDAQEVIGSQATYKHNLQLQVPGPNAPFDMSRIDESTLPSLVGFASGSVEIKHKERFILQYQEGERVRIPHGGPVGDDSENEVATLPSVHDSIQDGAAYLVTAVEFAHRSSGHESQGWLALIEATTGSVLHLRSMVGCVLDAEIGDVAEDGSPSASTDIAGNADTRDIKVIFFDIGDTLGRPQLSAAGELTGIDIFAHVPEVLLELSDNNLRLGVISDPGPFDPGLIRSFLDDAGIGRFFEADLSIFGAKNSEAIFDRAATTSGEPPAACLFVGEDARERDFASAAGFLVKASVNSVFDVATPDAAIAWVYESDPVTRGGSTAPGPSSPQDQLNRYRQLVALQGLRQVPTGQDQPLDGEYVQIADVDAPSPVIPSSPAPGDFRFNVNTNDFGAVNAYYNCDRLFRLLDNFGLDTRSYFDGTQFPVNVDHRVRFGGSANSINARAPGTRFPPASDGFHFALAARNTAVGMATAWRVVLHEFGHAILWDNVGSPNFRFAHSAGDAMAAILNDPRNQAPRGDTFPWVGIGRSHLRPVSDWAWYGTRYRPFRFGDGAGYIAEQILSSTLFRLYQAAGGDSADVNERDFAAHYTVFLIIKAVGLMSLVNNPANPEGYANLMMQADTGSFRYLNNDVRIGVLRKVVRWAFEMQGAFRPAPLPGQQPTNQVGFPPAVDVFVNDGRGGTYEYSSNAMQSADVWNRQQADGGTVHQSPVIGRTNFAYVRVANRGVQSATNVAVDGFQSLGSGQIWPLNWEPLTTASVAATGDIASGQEQVIGPFQWTPTSSAPALLMSVSATGDRSNLARFSGVTPIEVSRLVPFDNNIAHRTMSAVTAVAPTA